MKFAFMIVAAALATGIDARAQTPPASGPEHAAHHAPADDGARSDGEVRKVDKAQGKVTLRHGPIRNLDMPAMTMVFRVIDPKLLDGLEEGDKVKFTAGKTNGVFTLTAIHVVK